MSSSSTTTSSPYDLANRPLTCENADSGAGSLSLSPHPVRNAFNGNRRLPLGTSSQTVVLLVQQAYTFAMTTVPEDTRRKHARLAMRLTPDQDALIRDAAAVTGQSLTEFVTSAAVTRAEGTLADRRVFRLDDAAWAEFTAILDRPAMRIPELANLLNEPAPWDK